jgi:hypothetical protein
MVFQAYKDEQRPLTSPMKILTPSSISMSKLHSSVYRSVLDVVY